MKLVQDRKINLTIGFFASLPPRDAIMKASYVYFTTNLVWIVPPGRPQSALQKLMNPLKLIVWLWFVASLVIGVIVIVIISRLSKDVQNFIFGRRIQTPLLNFINIILGNSLHILPYHNFARFLFINFTFYCFILRSTYLCGLVKFMQLDTRDSQLMTTKEIIEHELNLYMLHSALAYLDELPSVQSRASLISYSEFNAKMMNAVNDPYFNGTFLTTTAHLAYRNLKAFPKYFNYAPESIYTLNVVLYMQQESCFKKNFDGIIINLVCSGLINKWASNWIDQKYLSEQEKNNLQALNVIQLEGAFELLIGGTIVGIIVFICELFHRVELRKIKLSRNTNLLFPFK